MKYLEGKSFREIEEDFRLKYNIPLNEWSQFRKLKRNPLLRNMVLIWTIPLFMIGLSFLISLIGAGMNSDFPRIFNVEDPLFFQRLINSISSIVLISISLILIIVPIVKLSNVYDKNGFT